MVLVSRSTVRRTAFVAEVAALWTFVAEVARLWTFLLLLQSLATSATFSKVWRLRLPSTAKVTVGPNLEIAQLIEPIEHRDQQRLADEDCAGSLGEIQIVLRPVQVFRQFVVAR